MDTSEIYIKMCGKTEEIQSIGIPINDPKSYIIERDMNSTNYHIVWLPRQDQLQEMVEKYLDEKVSKEEISAGDIGHVIFHFIIWLNKQKGYQKLCKILKDWPSMEQLWLAFVMKEKFGKIWNGEEWIKND